MTIKKNSTLKELVTQNTLHETKYVDVCMCGSIEASKRIMFSIKSSEIISEEKNNVMIANPVIILNLKSSAYVFNDDSLFKKIEFFVGGNCLDVMNNEQIKIWNKIHGLEFKKFGSKIYFPIPFDILNKGNGILISELKFQDIQFFVEFSSSPIVDIIDDSYLRIELLTVSENPDYSIISNYFYQQMKKYHQHLKIEDMKKSNYSVITEITKNQYDVFEIETTNGYFFKSLYFNHIVDRFFIYFQNSSDNSIYTNTQQFETIEFTIDDEIVSMYNYFDILFDNTKENLGYELPKGIYEIKWNSIKYKNLSNVNRMHVSFSGLMVPENCNLVICANSLNYLVYKNGRCELFLLN